MQSIPNNIYYQPNTEYDLAMSEYQFHDSGIVDEGLSDETGSVEESPNNQENRSDVNDSLKKPSQSYLEIIAEAILKAPNRMMQLFEIYNYFQRKYRYFAENVNKSWKNSVRHNLSLNDCFVKAGRGTNGKGHFWRIYESAEREFEQGRFRRRRFRQQMRQLQMITTPIPPPPYGHPSGAPFYSPPANPYYMCSSSPPSYQTMYSTPNTSTETQPLTSPTPYPFYDPYSGSSYYPTHFHSMASSYTSPNEPINYEV